MQDKLLNNNLDLETTEYVIQVLRRYSAVIQRNSVAATS